MTTLTFNIEPRGKGRPRLGRHTTFTDTKTRAFERALQAMARAQWSEPPTPNPVRLFIRLIFAPPKRPTRAEHTVKPDADNCVKGILDAMNGILWFDDSQVIELTAHKLYDFHERKPRIEMEFQPLIPAPVPKKESS